MNNKAMSERNQAATGNKRSGLCIIADRTFTRTRGKELFCFAVMVEKTTREQKRN
jgi:hypothetical protein